MYCFHAFAIDSSKQKSDSRVARSAIKASFRNGLTNVLASSLALLPRKRQNSRVTGRSPTIFIVAFRRPSESQQDFAEINQHVYRISKRLCQLELQGPRVLPVSNSINTLPGNEMLQISSYFASLDKAMYEDHVAFSQHTNPVRIGLHSSDTKVLAHVVLQYTQFSKRIVRFLEIARDSLRDWSPVSAELDRNIAEETGSSTDGVSHYELLRRGMREDFGVSIDAVSPSPATANFINSAELCLSNNDPVFVAGGVYGIEATAPGEITVLRDVVNEYSMRLHGKALSRASIVLFFLDAHINDFEIGHRDGLQQALAPFLVESNRATFNAGFHAILSTMDTWWSELQHEALRGL